ncbi:hypothetical protein B0H14DRAFT_3481198 [Mycena olivaceomarginata]|nr:hypothetical protein B0H14DRAFT_3481198 [Mycena olivaceomarginata]
MSQIRPLPLPAFCDTDVRNWMQSTFPSELSLLQAKEGSPADLLLVQNAGLRKALEDLYRIANIGDAKLTKLTELFERRTAVLSSGAGVLEFLVPPQGPRFFFSSINGSASFKHSLCTNLPQL